ncbi:hypothetical protein DKX38_023397 [Salix brachista]|uniref:Uncharacterized protein n=1 Tax=Salix brachista TaxID=2182728 RepID=A0A5N5JIU7_9ROSI|nr:hypothetical protein DKX38_023397 [Salix brachista]
MFFFQNSYLSLFASFEKFQWYSQGNRCFVFLSDIARIVDCSCTFCSVSLTFLSASIWKLKRLEMVAIGA